MHRTTVYFPDDLREQVSALAEELRCTEAEVVREAVRRYAAGRRRPRPTVPLFSSGRSALAERVDDELRGFGER